MVAGGRGLRYPQTPAGFILSWTSLFSSLKWVESCQEFGCAALVSNGQEVPLPKRECPRLAPRRAPVQGRGLRNYVLPQAWLPGWKLRTPKACPVRMNKTVCTRERLFAHRSAVGPQAAGDWASGEALAGQGGRVVGGGAARLPVQGRASSEELLEWAPGPGSKLGQIWDFLWNFPLSPPCPPSFIFQPVEDLPALNLFPASTCRRPSAAGGRLPTLLTGKAPVRLPAPGIALPSCVSSLRRGPPLMPSVLGERELEKPQNVKSGMGPASSGHPEVSRLGQMCVWWEVRISGRGPVCGVVILLVAGHAGWLQSHARQMFQTELGPASSSSFLEAGGKWGLSFCPGQLPGPGEGGGPLIPSHGPAQERRLGLEVALRPSILLLPGHRRAMNHSLAEPGLEETGGPGPSSAPPPAIPWRSHTVTDTVARPKADTAHNLPAGTQATLGSTHMTSEGWQLAASSSGARGCSRARAQLPVGSVAWPCPPLGQPLAELAQQSSRHLPSPEPKRRLQCPREQEPGCGGQGPGLGGRNIPAPSPPQPCEDRPALPACPLTQASRSQAGLAPPTTPIHPNLLPHHFGSGTSPCWLGQEEMWASLFHFTDAETETWPEGAHGGASSLASFPKVTWISSCRSSLQRCERKAGTPTAEMVGAPGPPRGEEAEGSIAQIAVYR
ncbi:hypothetical protein Cadr_000026244 [Camelus dromedarius]|uniref:Uncharacterized protein n=1 Tax=Camelus dromedarius TaxID=9838 RepID=A0A5N4CDK6_CAMDR|nr:hypothetical protein Cadr_000026244 [Camelus dromedarius]